MALVSYNRGNGVVQPYSGSMSVSVPSRKRSRESSLWSFLPDPRKLAKQAIHWGVKTFDPSYTPAGWKRTSEAFDNLTSGNFSGFGKNLLNAPKVKKLQQKIDAFVHPHRLTGPVRKQLTAPPSRALTVYQPPVKKARGGKKRFMASGVMAVGKARKSRRRKRSYKRRR